MERTVIFLSNETVPQVPLQFCHSLVRHSVAQRQHSTAQHSKACKARRSAAQHRHGHSAALTKELEEDGVRVVLGRFLHGVNKQALGMLHLRQYAPATPHSGSSSCKTEPLNS